MSEAMEFTDAEKSEIARTVEFTADDVTSPFDDAKVHTVSRAWFTVHAGEDFDGVVSAILSDPDVELWKAERGEGFVSAKHTDVVNAE